MFSLSQNTSRYATNALVNNLLTTSQASDGAKIDTRGVSEFSLQLHVVKPFGKRERPFPDMSGAPLQADTVAEYCPGLLPIAPGGGQDKSAAQVARAGHDRRDDTSTSERYDRRHGRP